MPGRVGGKPTLGNSRVPVELIAECLDEGESPEEIAFNYTVRLEDVLNFKTYRDSRARALQP